MNMPIERANSIRIILEHMLGTTTTTAEVPRAKRKTYNFSETIGIWKLVYDENMEGTCKLCDKNHIWLEIRSGEKAWEISHLKPVGDGGSDDPSNLRPLCRPCNRSMGKRDFRDFVLKNYPDRYDKIVKAFKLI